MAVSEEECPCSYNDGSGCRDLPKCSYNVKKHDLCEADVELPDGNAQHDVNNCLASYDVFRYRGGKPENVYGKASNDKCRMYQKYEF